MKSLGDKGDFCCLECVDDYEAGRTFDSEEK